jgi:hypothetical protein
MQGCCKETHVLKLLWYFEPWYVKRTHVVYVSFFSVRIDVWVAACSRIFDNTTSSMAAMSWLRNKPHALDGNLALPLELSTQNYFLCCHGSPEFFAENWVLKSMMTITALEMRMIFKCFSFALDQFSLSWKCRVACQCAKYDSRHFYSYTIGFLVAAWLIMCCTFKIAFKLTQFCSSNDKSSSSIRRFVYHLTNVFVKMVCSRKVNIYFIFELMSYY